FLDFSDGANIDLTKYRIPTVQVQMTLVDVLITNQSTVWENGILKHDSDGDGLSDEKEISLGSNPNSADSDQNGVSDYIENYLYGTPCQGVNKITRVGTCSPFNAQNFTVSCDDLRVSAPGAIPVVFRDSDHAGFNDCEKRLLGGREDRWDSNGDWIPDAI